MSDDNYIHDPKMGDSLEPMVNDAEEAELDALLARFGADYNRPPDIVPREEMWHEIREKGERRRAIRRQPIWGVLAAAGLLLGVGIGIGVEVHSRVGPHTSPLAQSASQGASQGTSRSVPQRVPQVAVTAAQSHDSTIGTGNATEAQSVQPEAQPRIVTNRGTYASANSAAAPSGNARSQAYALATVRHFTAVEALLTSYRTEPHDARGDAEMASWARALLSQTRLLLDSPAAADPARQKLLQDLELVLVQMTQLSPANTPIDREMIDGSVRHSDVITRLRTAVPAGGATHLQ
jgi:hypothetical protein